MKRTHLKSCTDRVESHYIQLMIFMCLGFLLYFKSFGHGWTFDDYFVVLENQDIRSLKDFIKNGYPGRPLRELSFMLDYTFFGFTPKYWHLQNILIHSLNAWLIYVLLMTLSNSKSLAWLTSLFFLVHPIQVEVVAQISHRKDSLCLFFILISFHSYVIYRRTENKKNLLLSLLAFALSLLSKQTALVLPLVVVTYEIIVLNSIQMNRQRWLFAALFGASLVFFLVCYAGWGQRFDDGSRTLLSFSNIVDGYTIKSYYLTLFSSWGFIITKLFWPVGLSVNYMIPPPETIFDQRLVVLSLFFLAVSMTVYHAFRQSPLLLFFIFWSFAFFLPASNVFPVTFHFVADRYLYVASVGFCFVVAALLTSYFHKTHALIALLLISLLSLATLKQIDVWDNNLSLWENSLRYNPKSARAIMNVALFKFNDNDELFLEKTLKAIDTNPYDPLPYNSLANFYYKKNDADNAIINYEKFIEIMDKKGAGMYKGYYLTAKERLAGLKRQ